MIKRKGRRNKPAKNIYGCCYCKVKRRPDASGLLLEELNEIMLRVVYFMTILIIFLMVFCCGLVLLPFGYLAMIYTRLRLVLLKKKSYFLNKDNYQMKKGILKNIGHKECARKCWEGVHLVLFVFYGIPFMFYLNIKDSIELVHHALNS